jgi:hypothetical protein
MVTESWSLSEKATHGSKCKAGREFDWLILALYIIEALGVGLNNFEV